MEFSTRKKNPKAIISDNLSELYPHNLQLYKIPPGNEIALSEFEDLALERLHLLRILEQTSQKGHKLFSQQWFNTLEHDLRKEKLFKYLNLFDPRDTATTLAARRADHISHFILRLAYCRSQDLRRWFLNRELEWFKVRFMKIAEYKPDLIKTFLDLNNLTYKCITSDEKQNILNELNESTMRTDGTSSLDFYKVPFTEVCGLVKNRRVFVKNGFAYIPSFELVSCILFVFRAHLSEALAYASRQIPKLDDDRLNNLLSNLNTSYTGRDYAVPENKDAINIENLDQYSRKHYPLCMRYIHETFRSTHHMKHGCRMQYGLFVKGIGVIFEDALRFWQEEFTKLIDANTFEKRYSYDVKHQFGKVGRMLSYSPYSCMKLIMNSVGPGEHHGCPFRHFDESHLRQKLLEYGISGEGIGEIFELVKNSQYQIACSKYFELTHNRPSKSIITHPNQYFEESKSLEADHGKGSVSKMQKASFKAAKQDESLVTNMEM